MLIGLDVGGTHTDAVLLRSGSGKILATAKVPTHRDDVLPGLLEALAAVLRGYDPRSVRRVSISTTLGVNALLTGRNDPVGMLVVSGPGIDPRLFWGPDPLFHPLDGAQDHRGRVVSVPRREDVWRAFREIAAHKAEALGIVCKFSPKNPELEVKLAAMAEEEFGPDLPAVLGSSVSGSLNFPRRMHTVWCNASLTGISRSFTLSLETAAHSMGLACPIVVLKADAGVFSAARSALEPASAMRSGPAASLLGVWSLAARAGLQTDDVLMIDMGGTSTDLALMAGGYPLLDPAGLSVRGRPTLIRSLWTRSLPLGGDSSLRLRNGLPLVGPDRSGPALALESDFDPINSRPPTLTDALNVLGLAKVGDAAISHLALNTLALTANSPAPDGRSLAALFADRALHGIKREFASLLAEVNARPVYTIRELLVNEPLKPARAVFIGGPAEALADRATQVLGLPVLVPAESAVANALGAALARPTRTADLYADTQLRRMSIPDFGLERAIDNTYGLEQARRDMADAFAALSEQAAGADPEEQVQIISAESFAMLDEHGGQGRVIRLRAQQPAGLIEFAE